jgi:hypothetical protein
VFTPVLHVCLWDCIYSSAIQVEAVSTMQIRSGSSICPTEKDPFTGYPLTTSQYTSSAIETSVNANFRAFAWGTAEFPQKDPKRSASFQLLSTTPVTVAGPFCFSSQRLGDGKYPLGSTMPLTNAGSTVLKMGQYVSLC